LHSHEVHEQLWDHKTFYHLNMLVKSERWA
jgi:hypothetical protein